MKGNPDWEELYTDGDTPWDRGAPHPALVAWLAKNSLPGPVLVPGCGRGHDVRAIAAQGHDVTGFDLAPSAIKAAGEFPATANEIYVQGDFFAPPLEWMAAFDSIFEHTCFCAIPPAMRAAYAKQAARLLKPGGHLLAIFFLDPGNDEDGPPFGCTMAELDEFFAEDFQLIQEERPIATFAGRENREILRLLQRKATDDLFRPAASGK